MLLTSDGNVLIIDYDRSTSSLRFSSFDIKNLENGILDVMLHNDVECMEFSRKIMFILNLKRVNSSLWLPSNLASLSSTQTKPKLFRKCFEINWKQKWQ